MPDRKNTANFAAFPDDVARLLADRPPSLRSLLLRHHDRIADLRAAGVPWSEIGRLLGRSATTVFCGWRSLQRAIDQGRITLPSLAAPPLPAPAKIAGAAASVNSSEERPPHLVTAGVPTPAPAASSKSASLRERLAASRSGTSAPQTSGIDRLRAAGVDVSHLT